MTAHWQDEVVDFWFALPPRQWWNGTELDTVVGDRFRTLWERERAAPAGSFLADAHDALAAILLFDQFPRNMFRGEALSFATDALARDIAKAALDRGYDRMLASDDQRLFLYMPLQHSEDAADQDRSVALFEGLGNPQAIDFAEKHRAMIARFGRFPSRNIALGRESTAEELAAGLPEPF